MSSRNLFAHQTRSDAPKAHRLDEASGI